VLMQVPHEPGRGIRFQAHLETLPNFQPNLPALVRIGKHLVLRRSDEQLPRAAHKHHKQNPSCSVPHPVPPPLSSRLPAAGGSSAIGDASSMASEIPTPVGRDLLLSSLSPATKH